MNNQYKTKSSAATKKVLKPQKLKVLKTTQSMNRILGAKAARHPNIGWGDSQNRVFQKSLYYQSGYSINRVAMRRLYVRCANTTDYFPHELIGKSADLQVVCALRECNFDLLRPVLLSAFGLPPSFPRKSIIFKLLRRYGKATIDHLRCAALFEFPHRLLAAFGQE